MTPRRILITALGHIADSLAAGVVVRALRDAYPHARITVLAYEELAPLWEHAPEVTNVVTMRDRRQGGLRGVAERLLEGARLVPRLWRQADLVVAPQLGRSAALLALATGAPRRAGFARGRWGRLFTTSVALPDGLTFRDANVALLRALGIETADTRLRVAVTARNKTSAGALRGRSSSGPVVVVHPGADWGCQMWGFRQWAQVVDHLHERWQAAVIITGTASERWLAERIARAAHRPPVNACGRTNLTELAALVENADLMVAVNSGPAAMAVATGTPVVILNALYYDFEESLWGAHPGDSVVTDLVVRDDGAHRWYGDCRAQKLRRERHCVNPACIGQGVMGAITPEMVIRAIDERLAARGQREEAGDGGGDGTDGNGRVHRPGSLPGAGGGPGVRPGAVPVTGGSAAPLA